MFRCAPRLFRLRPLPWLLWWPCQSPSCPFGAASVVIWDCWLLTTVAAATGWDPKLNTGGGGCSDAVVGISLKFFTAAPILPVTRFREVISDWMNCCCFSIACKEGAINWDEALTSPSPQNVMNLSTVSDSRSIDAINLSSRSTSQVVAVFEIGHDFWTGGGSRGHVDCSSGRGKVRRLRLPSRRFGLPFAHFNLWMRGVVEIGTSMMPWSAGVEGLCRSSKTPVSLTGLSTWTGPQGLTELPEQHEDPLSGHGRLGWKSSLAMGVSPAWEKEPSRDLLNWGDGCRCTSMQSWFILPTNR